MILAPVAVVLVLTLLYTLDWWLNRSQRAQDHYAKRLAAFKARHPDYQPPYIKCAGRYVRNPRWVEGQFESYDSP